MSNLSALNKTISAAPIHAVISALRNHPDFVAIKVWTKADCEDYARSYLEEEAPDISDDEFDSRLDSIVEKMMENRHSKTLEPLRDVSDEEADAMQEFASECDTGD